MKTVNSHVFSVRLTDSEKQIIDRLAEEKSISRSEAVRLALRVSAPLLAANLNINLSRVLMSLEILLAECIERVDRRDPEKVAELVEIAAKRVDEFHT